MSIFDQTSLCSQQVPLPRNALGKGLGKRLAGWRDHAAFRDQGGGGRRTGGWRDCGVLKPLDGLKWTREAATKKIPFFSSKDKCLPGIDIFDLNRAKQTVCTHGIDLFN
jgi:hypothetical protein